MPIEYGPQIRKKMQSGVDKLARAVAVTLGPKGRNVCIEKAYGAPLITKDGVSVAKEIEVADEWENIGARLVREVSSKTSDDAGDGTTTATVLAAYLYGEGLKLVEGNMAPTFLKRGMDKALAMLVEQIHSLSCDVRSETDVENIATISANGDRIIGALIAQAVSKVGKDGIVNIEESKSTQTTLDTTDGMRIDRGFVNPYFISDHDTQSTTLEDVLVFVTDQPMNGIRVMVPFLNEVVKAGKPVIWIAPDFGGEALPAFVQNFMQGALKSVPVKAPGFGERQTEMLKDIAALTGATLVSKDLGMTFEGLTMDVFGTCRSVKITEKHTTFVDGGGKQEAIDARVNQIRAEIGRTGSEFDREKLQERLGKLLGGICSIKVGGSSELALKEIKARMEDALFATKAAIDEGVVAGGGTTYLRAAVRVTEIIDLIKAGEFANDPGFEMPDLPTTDEEWAGFNLVLRACERPMWQIITNAGGKAELFVERVRESDSDFYGYDGTDGTLKNLMEAGVIDPTKVARCAVTNAVSIVGTLLTTECAIRKPASSQDGAG